MCGCGDGSCATTSSAPTEPTCSTATPQRSGRPAASFHCDFSVSPIGPLNYIATAAAHDGRRGRVLNAAERVSVAQAMKGATTDAAWMCHADGLVGSLAAGKAADFVLLGDDPLSHQADPDAVRDIAVLATYLDGAQVHSAW